MSRPLLAWQPPVLRWYRRHRRALPWRETRDPYAIWVSEVMLQQTQVATALPYYRAFLARFPTFASLAAAREPQVLAAWSGLGYYRRARHLHAAARQVVCDHHGRIPDNPQTFARLPGVGRYTTGAVLSISFDRPLPALDGNVARVLSRVYAMRATVRDPGGARRLWSLAGTLVPMRRPGDWNQALMELGATVCLPRTPRCGDCPIAKWCAARAQGRTGAYPPAPARRATERVRRAVALIERRRRMLMTPRRGPLLEGLWEPPGVELPGTSPARPRLARALRALGVHARLVPTGRTVRHVITHRRVEVEVWRGTLIDPAPRRLRFVDPRRPSVPLTALAGRLARGTDREDWPRGPK
jgi:A/G-specific adenine glycosylase